MKKIFSLVFILFLVINVFAQTTNNFNPLYDDSEVPRVDITINPEYLQIILQPGNEESNIEYPATFQFKSTKYSIRVENIGFRLRGNTSRYAKKKSFKVSFNTFVVGQKVQGIEKLNLNGEHNDPSLIRSKLVWDLMAGIGLPAPRANHVALYINDQYFGVYANVEHIDENFVKSRFSNCNGNLYKCLYPANLSYRGDNPNAYKFVQNGHRVYDLKTNTEKDDYSDLAQLVKIINQTPISKLPEKLEPVFNVNNFLKYLAVEALTGNWDGYSFNQNNFYLYKNTITGRFEFIPYDTDNTFGIDWFNIDWAKRSVTSWASSDLRPLTKNILAVKEYRNRYYFYLKKLINGDFSVQSIQAKSFALRSTIEDYVFADPYRPLDYGWNFQDFYNSFTSALGGHVKYGLIPYVSKRIQYANSQFSIGDIPPVVSNVTWLAYGHRVPIIVTANVDDETLAEFNLFFKTDNSGWKRIAMKNTSKNHFTTAIGPWVEKAKRISFYFEATDKNGNKTREPLKSEYVAEFNQIELPLCINEVMTSNSTTYPDEFGYYSDWIELYNFGKTPISLNGMTITDTLGKPAKSILPNIIINPGEFKLLWADGQPENGENHLPFKLNKQSEEIGLFALTSNGYKLVDGFRFGSIDKNASFGYYPDGLGLPQILLSPTPGLSNVLTTKRFEMVLPQIITYPNPFSDRLTISLSYQPAYDYTITIISSQGRIIAKEDIKKGTYTKYEWQPNGIPSGIYLIYITLHGKQDLVIQPQKVIFDKKSN